MRLPGVMCLPALALAAAGVWLDVPYVRQEKHGCGAACIAMVCRYWRAHGHANIADPDPAAILRQLYAPKSRGIYGADMERYFRSAGLDAFAFRGEQADLAAHLAKGRPLIVGLGPTGQRDLHFAVVVGLDSVGDSVLLNDPAVQKLRKVGRKEFEKQWGITGNWTLLAVPRPGG